MGTEDTRSLLMGGTEVTLAEGSEEPPRDPLQGHDGREQPERAVVGVKERGALAVVAQITRVLNHSEPHLPVVELPDHRTFASRARPRAPAMAGYSQKVFGDHIRLGVNMCMCVYRFVL